MSGQVMSLISVAVVLISLTCMCFNTFPWMKVASTTINVVIIITTTIKFIRYEIRGTKSKGIQKWLFSRQSA